MERLEYMGGINVFPLDVKDIEDGRIEEIAVPMKKEDAAARFTPYKPFQKWFIKEFWYLKGYKDGNESGRKVGRFKYLAAGDELPKGGKWMPAEKMPDVAARVFIRIDAVKICRADSLNSFDAARMGYKDLEAMKKDLLPLLSEFVTAMQITVLK